MKGKSVLIEVAKCIGCRGCQVACKQWHELPAEKTINSGSYQNPPNMSAATYTIVRFNEVEKGDEIKWNFFKDQCRHCVEPPCKYEADEIVKGAIEVEKNGAVIFTDKTKKLANEDVNGYCPYSIPHKCEKDSGWYKCDFCYDRLENGLQPACVKACPTGALTFGERDEILALAKKRLAEVKKNHPDAALLDEDDVRWIYLLHEKEEDFQMSLKNENARYYGLNRVLSPNNPAWIAAGSLAMLFKWREKRVEKDG